METLGIFSDVDGAARAVDNLVKEGFTESQVTSLTSVPYPAGVLVDNKRKSWFRWLALAGAIAGALGGFALAAGTAWVYPVQTGDKPIISSYPTAIITYELTMLFAMIGTIIGMFLEMKLPSFKNHPYDPAISEGCIGISVSIHAGGEVVKCDQGTKPGECIGGSASIPSGEQRSRAVKIMREAGALRIITEGSP